MKRCLVLRRLRTLLGSGLLLLTVSWPGRAALTQGGGDSQAAALQLWKRTLRAQREVPLRGRAVVTRWSGKDAVGRRQVIDLVEGTAGRYRLAYVAPDAVKGRVIVCDGKTIYQYEPRHQVVLRRPALPAGDLLGTAGADFSTDRARLLPAAAQIAGRSVRVLEVRGGRDGVLREKRWVDEKTARSLCIIEYTRDRQRPMRRIELTRVSFSPNAPLTTFKPDFPRAARVLAAANERAPDVEAEVRRLGLPPNAAGYYARSVVVPRRAAAAAASAGAPPLAPADAAAAAHGQHVLYSNGMHSVSVFVTGAAAGKGGLSLRPTPGWTRIALSGKRIGYARAEDAQGRSAVAWMQQGGRRCVALGRLPLDRLIALARGLAHP